MATSVNNVTAGKPKIGGAISVAAAGTTPPTDATTALANTYTGLGYCGDSGLVNSNSPSSENVKSWGGDNIITLQSEKPDTYKFVLVESLNVDVLKFVYGDDNVSGTLATGLTIKANSKELPEHVLVADMVLRDDAVSRIVLPKAKIKEIADITYADNSVVAYEVTVDAFPDAYGNTHYNYIKKPTSPAPDPNPNPEEEDEE